MIILLKTKKLTCASVGASDIGITLVSLGAIAEVPTPLYGVDT